jgi:hypothetical protein
MILIDGVDLTDDYLIGAKYACILLKKSMD